MLDRRRRRRRPRSRKSISPFCQARAALPARLSRRPSRSSCWCSACCSASRSISRTSSPRSNLSTVLTQVTIIGILGIAQTLVILTAGIDLSVGVIMVISSVVMGRLARRRRRADRLSPFPLGLLCGAACGFLNGALVTRLQDAAVHRHARHAEHHRRAQHVLFAERDHSRAGHRGQGAVPAIDGHIRSRSAARASSWAASC